MGPLEARPSEGGKQGSEMSLHSPGRQTANSGEANIKTTTVSTPLVGHSSLGSGQTSNTKRLFGSRSMEA